MTHIDTSGYSTENLDKVYKVFKAFHRETIHQETTTKARKAFAKLLQEETELGEQGTQAYLHQIQQEIHQFRDERQEYLNQRQLNKGRQQQITVIEHSSVVESATEEDKQEIITTLDSNKKPFEKRLEKFFDKRTKPTRTAEASSSNIKRKQRETPVVNPVIIEEQPELVEENLLIEDSSEDEIEMADAPNFQQLLDGLNNLVNALGNNNNNNREARYAKITDFYGDTQDPVGWLQDFENACQANVISDNRKIQIVRAYLKGAAATWLANKRLLTHDWPTQWNPTNNQQVNQLASFTCQFKI